MLDEPGDDVVGRLAAAQRERTELAEAREREARSLFGVSRVLATRESTTQALGAISMALREATGMRRVWITLGGDVAGERVAADSSAGTPPASGRVRVLQRRPGDEPAAWAMMIFGMGAVGYAMRRRQVSTQVRWA